MDTPEERDVGFARVDGDLLNGGTGRHGLNHHPSGKCGQAVIFECIFILMLATRKSLNS